MPTLKSYKNDPGYYIRAWTPELGNINYKLREEGWKIIESYGRFEVDDTIAWTWVSALKAAGVVYTDGSGTVGPGDEEFEPGEMLSSETTSNEKSNQFFECIREHVQLSDEEQSLIKSVLGVSSSESSPEKLYDPVAERVNERVEELISTQELKFEQTLNGHNEPVKFTLAGSQVTPDEITTFSVVLPPEDVDQSDPDWKPGCDYFKLVITFSREHIEQKIADSISYWVNFDESEIIQITASTSDDDSWEQRAEIYGQLSSLLPVIIEELQNGGVSLRNPDEATEVSFTSEIMSALVDDLNNQRG